MTQRPNTVQRPHTRLVPIVATLALCAAAPFAAPPANDTFAAATDLGSASFDTTGTIAEADDEIGEPLLGGGATVWYRWTAPHAGRFRLSTEGSFASSGIDTTVSVFTGPALASLVVVGTNNDFAGAKDSRVDFLAVGGAVYRFQVDAVAPGTGGFRLALSELSVPANDPFASATVVGPADFSLNATLLNATSETGEPLAAGGGGSTVWFQWTAPKGGFAVISTEGSAALGGIDTTLGVYTGASVNALTSVASNDEAVGTDARVSFNAVSGTTYRVQVDAKTVADGAFKLSLSQPPSPSNDAFNGAIVLNGAEFGSGGLSSNGTREPGEPDTNGTGAGQSVWYSWTPTVATTAVVTTRGSAGSAPLGVYTGASVNALTLVGKDAETVVFAATAGTTYQIAVDPPVGATLGFVLNGFTKPTNDARVFATPIEGRSGTFRGHTFGATVEAGEPTIAVGAVGRSVWFAWTPTVTGNAVVKIDAATFPSVVAVFNSEPTPALVAQGANSVSFPAVAGTTYVIGVDASSGVAGTFSGSVAIGPSNDAFANRIAVASGPFARVTGTNVGATTEPGEPTHAAFAGAAEASVWWSWTAQQDGDATIDTSGSGFETVVAVYTGVSVSTLSRVATSAFGAEPTVGGGRVTFEATAGRTYAIAVVGARGGQGDIRLSVLPGTVARATSSLAVTKLTGVLDFRRAGRDSLTLSAVLPAPKGVLLTNTQATVAVGGLVRTFTLSSKGVGKNGSDTLRISGSTSGNRVVTMTLTREDLSALAALGFSNETTFAEPINVPVTIVVGGIEYTGSRQTFYTATQGKTGVVR